MTQGPAKITRFAPGSPALRTCAVWRHDEWFRKQGRTLEWTIESFGQFVERQDLDREGIETALLAEIDGVPVGVCLLARNEIDPRHDVSPWLAGLYVAAEFRRQSIGSDLVRAVEGHARDRGLAGLYLYTGDREGFYGRLGWLASERFDWDGEPFVLMHRDLRTVV